MSQSGEGLQFRVLSGALEKAKKELRAKLCDFCIHLSPTEAEQDAEYARDRKPRRQHWCKLHNVPLHHYGQHPHIPKPKECPGPFSQ